jgi:hypothetical protein
MQLSDRRKSALKQKTDLKIFSVKPYPVLPTHVKRFMALSPSEKIRLGERWKRELKVLGNMKESIKRSRNLEDICYLLTLKKKGSRKSKRSKP